MRIQATAFTDQGKKLIDELFFSWNTESVAVRNDEPLADWTKRGFEEGNALIFVGATGIASRSIAPFIKSKLEDPAVIVIDELGKFVIPILSGHVGGANELAIRLADKLNAIPVITTATDINDKFAIDVWARKNGLNILNKDGIAKVSSKLLRGINVSLYIDDKFRIINNSYEKEAESQQDKFSNKQEEIEAQKLPEGVFLVDSKEAADIVISDNEVALKGAALALKPKTLILGIGCKKGKSYEEILGIIKANDIDLSEVFALATIDIKSQEQGLIQLASRHRLNFLTYTSKQLMALEGDFTGSTFVRKQTGTDNVCERSALLAAGDKGELILKKQADKGITLAVARRCWKVNFDE